MIKPIKNAPIAYTIGEPAGIGADVILQLSQTDELSDIVCVGDARLLQQRARLLGLDVKNLNIIDVPLQETVIAGKPTIKNVNGVLEMLDLAIDGCLDGTYSAMVTGPVHKGIINDAIAHSKQGNTALINTVPSHNGLSNNLKLFSGHTEYLAQRTKADLPVMMLASPSLRVVLVTTHLPLKDVSKAITYERVQQICQITHNDLQEKFGIKKPKLLICGLNPHAGEGGHLGMEEIDIIIPALEQLRSQGVNVLGPFPADTLFTSKNSQGADAVVAMYHDQGLPVLKAQGFGEAANITLGLPIIRTSVDHGTAFDLAGSGNADAGSLKSAIDVARNMVQARN